MAVPTITQPSTGSSLSSSVVRGQLQTLQNQIGALGTWIDVSGTIDGNNTTFTIAVSVTSDFLLQLARQDQYPTTDFTYVAGASTTTITYLVAPDASLSGFPHKAFVMFH